MIVKELRQGLRTWVFASAFITLQMLLVLTLALTAAAGNTEAASYFFWWLIGLILIGIMPMRGFNALTDEIRMQTLDLLVLTRLSAWRIAFGKWVALVSQSALLTLSILPYVVLRYYHGGVDPFREAAGLFLLWLLSSGLTAVIVCFSTQRSLILRLAVLAAIGFGGAPCNVLPDHPHDRADGRLPHDPSGFRVRDRLAVRRHGRVGILLLFPSRSGSLGHRSRCRQSLDPQTTRRTGRRGRCPCGRPNFSGPGPRLGLVDIDFLDPRLGLA